MESRSHPRESHSTRGLQGIRKAKPQGGGRKFEQYPEGSTTSVASEVEPTRSGYLNLDPGGMSKINWRQKGGQVSDYSRSPRGDPR